MSATIGKAAAAEALGEKLKLKPGTIKSWCNTWTKVKPTQALAETSPRTLPGKLVIGKRHSLRILRRCVP